MMLKNVEAKTVPRVGAVASSPEVLDQLLLRRLAGKVSRCLALEVPRGSELSTQMEFPFTPVLTGHTEKDESSAARGDNGRVETNVCRQTKGVQGVDVMHREMVEKELDRLIERRSRQKDPDEESELWQESVKAYEEKRRQMARLEWHLHHTAQAERLRRTLEALASHHEEQAARLMDVQPEGSA